MQDQAQGAGAGALEEFLPVVMAGPTLSGTWQGPEGLNLYLVLVLLFPGLHALVDSWIGTGRIATSATELSPLLPTCTWDLLCVHWSLP